MRNERDVGSWWERQKTRGRAAWERVRRPRAQLYVRAGGREDLGFWVFAFGPGLWYDRAMRAALGPFHTRSEAQRFAREYRTTEGADATRVLRIRDIGRRDGGAGIVREMVAAVNRGIDGDIVVDRNEEERMTGPSDPRRGRGRGLGTFGRRARRRR